MFVSSCTMWTEPKLDLSTIVDEYIYFPEQILTMCCPRIRSAGKILIKSISAMIEAQKIGNLWNGFKLEPSLPIARAKAFCSTTRQQTAKRAVYVYRCTYFIQPKSSGPSGKVIGCRLKETTLLLVERQKRAILIGSQQKTSDSR